MSSSTQENGKEDERNTDNITSSQIPVISSPSLPVTITEENAEDADPDHHHKSPGQQKCYQSSTQKTNLFSPITSKWQKFTQFVHFCILKFTLTLSLLAARNPKRCIGLILGISFLLLGVGYYTNFDIAVSEQDMFAPTGAVSRHYSSYISNVQGFPKPSRPIWFFVHADGGNVVTYEAMNRVFQVIDVVRSTEGFDKICSQSNYTDFYSGKAYCRIDGPSEFWYHNKTIFWNETQESDILTRKALSRETFPSGAPVFPEPLMTQHERNEDGIIDFALTMNVGFSLPELMRKDNADITRDFEALVIDRLLEVQAQWRNEPDNPYILEFYTFRSAQDELLRALYQDLPLIPLVFLIMVGFCCFVFFRRDKVQSRTMLGLGSVVTIALSISSGYGLMFICGVPFTNMAQILPFVVFGVGLDDTFIITGSYLRKNSTKDPVERIRETIEEVGNSIALTTITTVCAFALGCISSVPAIRWLCLYSFPTIAIDFVYQITFFVAILVLDEQRIQANRRDCCLCVVVPQEESATRDGKEETEAALTNQDLGQSDDLGSSDESAQEALTRTIASPHHESQSVADRFMSWYANKLLHPVVRLLVLVGFTAFLAGCCYSASNLKQEFKGADLLAEDSYALSFIEKRDSYVGEESMAISVYFRSIDQSDPQMQEEMLDFIADIVALPEFGKEPTVCWVRDFKQFQEGTSANFKEYEYLLDYNLTFEERLDVMLSMPAVEQLYGRDIARDSEGKIEASRCWVPVTKVDINVVREQIDLLAHLYDVASEQSINVGLSEEDYAFFTFEEPYFLWEFYTVAVQELAFTMVSGVFSISIIGFLLIPHWTATLFVSPLIVILYVDLLGTLQFAGLHINPLVYVCLVISVGLLVDFLMHIILRYYESTEKTREGKAKDTLETMGASILVGGLSTCLGVIPLAFANSEIIKTVFVSFIAMVTLGVGHGLILLPVLLSYMGPTVCIRGNKVVQLEDEQLKSSKD